MEPIFNYINANRKLFINRLIDYLRQPSISAHGVGMDKVADYLVNWLVRIGFDARLMPTPRWPLVLGHRYDQPGAPTVLLYGHYDVQPVDPVSEWLSPPFEPTVRGDNLFCRGATDDKGQVYAVLAAADAYLRTSGELPVNLKVMLEGEEEISSPNLAPLVREHRSMLACDAVLICDSNILDVDRPLIS